MTAKRGKGAAGGDGAAKGCTVEAIVTIDERGQLVLPKVLRTKAGLAAGDRLALTSWERGGRVCCLTLTKVDGLAEMVKDALGPVMKELL